MSPPASRVRHAARWRYALGRAALFPVQVFAAVTVIFLIIHVLPGSPVFKTLGVAVSDKQVSQATAALGLDHSLTRQYSDFVSGLWHADLGTSFFTSNPVVTDLRNFFPATLELAFASLLISLVLGSLVGVASGLQVGGKAVRLASGYRLVAGAIPEFLVGLVLIYVLVSRLNIAPGPTGQLDPSMNPPPRVTGMIVVDSILAGDGAALSSSLAHLALPALALGFGLGGPIARLLRVVVAQARQSDYVQYAQLCGLRKRSVVASIVRSTLVPLTTLLTVEMVLVMGQSVPVEIVFSWGGLGQYTVQAVQISDYPAVQGVVIVVTTFVLVTYLLTDLLQDILDPRVAAGRSRGPGLFARAGRMAFRRPMRPVLVASNHASSSGGSG